MFGLVTREMAFFLIVYQFGTQHFRQKYATTCILLSVMVLPLPLHIVVKRFYVVNITQHLSGIVTLLTSAVSTYC